MPISSKERTETFWRVFQDRSSGIRDERAAGRMLKLAINSILLALAVAPLTGCLVDPMSVPIHSGSAAVGSVPAAGWGHSSSGWSAGWGHSSAMNFQECSCGGECCEGSQYHGCAHPLECLRAGLQGMAVPVPGCYADWRAKRDLPEGPERASFHPLPTRPMFQPRPIDQGSRSESAGNLASNRFEGCAYGDVPEGVEWHTQSGQISSAAEDVDTATLHSPVQGSGESQHPSEAPNSQ
jgi:hypothetical protein